MLTLGILHETLVRWVPDPVRVTAATQLYVAERPDPDTGEMITVDRPDSVHILTELPGGARGIYHLSGALHHTPGFQIHLYGSGGTLRYHLGPQDRLLGGQHGDRELQEIDVPPNKQGRWQVEADFVTAIRDGTAPQLTDFATGLRYMEFTEAVERSAREATSVALPLATG